MSTTEYDLQRAQLMGAIGWAKKLRAELQPILDAHGDRVHFRPSSGGVAMVSLEPHRPQRGKSGIQGLRAIAADFEGNFRRYCVEIEHGRVTGEKELQSFLIRASYQNGRSMAPLIDAARAMGEALDLVFVTDEQLLPRGTSKVVCDLLALRRDPARGLLPVLLELKYDRQMKRLVEQVEIYARLIDLHADLFAQLFSALLGFEVVFAGPAEKWIVWPALGALPDPREGELGARGIRVVGYRRIGEGFGFQLGRRPSADLPP
jgi:hypothetical protein